MTDTREKDTRLAKALTVLLRHNPPQSMQSDGFVPVDDVLQALKVVATKKDVERVVNRNDKQRFEMANRQGIYCIRAVQVQLVPLSDLPVMAAHGTQRRLLPDIAMHGLLAGGPRKTRQHVHLCPVDPSDSRVVSGVRSDCNSKADLIKCEWRSNRLQLQVGFHVQVAIVWWQDWYVKDIHIQKVTRHIPILIAALVWVEYARAASDGHEFYISKNGVLLYGDLPSKYVSHACDYSDRSALPLPRVAGLDYTAEKEPEAGYMTVHSGDVVNVLSPQERREGTLHPWYLFAESADGQQGWVPASIF